MLFQSTATTGTMDPADNPSIRSSLHSPEFLVMNNNNYLPGIQSYNNSMFDVTMSRPEVSTVNTVSPYIASVNELNLDHQQSTNSVLGYCNRNEGSGICISPCEMNSAVNDAKNLDLLSAKLCEHQGSRGRVETDAPVLRDASNFPFLNPPVHSVSYAGGHNFTFTSPTQSCLHSPALVSSTPPRFQGSRATPQTFAPTGFTQWQHSVPHRIPWSSVGMTTQSGVSIFTGSAYPGTTSMCAMQRHADSSLSSFSCTTSMTDPVASCSEVPRRPKRHSSENLEFLGPTSKIHLTDEKFAKHMEGLSIQCLANTTDSNIESGSLHLKLTSDPVSQSFTNGSQSFISTTQMYPSQDKPWPNSQDSCWPDSRGDHWKSFQELEERLEVSDEEEADEQKLDKIKLNSSPTVHVVQGIDKMVSNQEIIPQNILDEIQRPRMEVILWTPPEDSVKKVMQSHKNGENNEDTKTEIIEAEFVPTSSSFPENGMVIDDVLMDTEMAEDSSDDL